MNEPVALDLVVKFAIVGCGAASKAIEKDFSLLAQHYSNRNCQNYWSA
jgi:hypothetical protein